MIKRYGEAADQRRCAPHQLDRIQTTALDVLESLIEATYTRERKDHLRSPNLGIEKLRFFFRIRTTYWNGSTSMTKRLRAAMAAIRR